MDSEGVSLPWIHNHTMMPWNDSRKGDCCGRFDSVTEGYYCKSCNFFVHKKCGDKPSESMIQHQFHPLHPLQLYTSPDCDTCDICRRDIVNQFYRCEICDFDIDLYCARYTPPDVIHKPEMHHHKLILFKKPSRFVCDAKCEKMGLDEFPYKCDECDMTFHMDCVWYPPEMKHMSKLFTIMDPEKVSLPWIHEHPMMLWNDLRKGDCCLRFDSISDGYYCKSCDFFAHKKCGDMPSEFSIQHQYHPIHPLELKYSSQGHRCDVCRWTITSELFYHCELCDFDIDLYCARYTPPPNVIDKPEMHHHKLILFKKQIDFVCDANCGKTGDDEFPYKCDECDINFHLDCVWYPPEMKHMSEVNHPYHPWHPLKFFRGRLPDYSDGKCRLCGKTIGDQLFYHCSSCNFTLDMHCVLHPPLLYLLDLKAHDHQLTLLPRLDSFTCNACGLKGDRSPYVCFPCGFMIHQECLGLPRLININRHEHRVSRTSVLGVVNSTCGVCRKKVDWTCGGYSCQKCHDYVVHSKCATRKDVWNGKELEGVPEEIEDIEPYVVIDENTIQHFSHKEHHLRLNINGFLSEDNKRCRACTHSICLQSFYGCMECDFILHKNCAELPKKKWHVLHNDRLTLVTNHADYFCCDGCHRRSNGFKYQHGDMEFDVMCGSISEPFFHPSHPQHPLYHILTDKDEICNGCIKEEYRGLRCIEDGCKFILGFNCATLPQVVKHRVDDHPLSLCYGEKANGRCWCDICEKEIDPKKWFYTCKDQQASLHTKCVLGDLSGFMPRSTVECYFSSYEVVLNNSISRPICSRCESRCIYPITLKRCGTLVRYLCSFDCV